MLLLFQVVTPQNSADRPNPGINFKMSHINLKDFFQRFIPINFFQFIVLAFTVK